MLENTVAGQHLAGSDHKFLQVFYQLQVFTDVPLI